MAHLAASISSHLSPNGFLVSTSLCCNEPGSQKPVPWGLLQSPDRISHKMDGEADTGENK
jgi:hypothetical protein